MGVTQAEIDSIKDYFQKGNVPQYMVGFNCRFSPMIQKLKKLISNRIGPVQIDYNVNAGFIPADHWTRIRLFRTYSRKKIRDPDRSPDRSGMGRFC